MSYPVLYGANETEFTTQGYGVLSDALSCIVTEELNGAFELEMRYPTNGLHGEYIIPGNIIVCPANLNSTRQAFRIYEVIQNINGVAEIYARHISYDLSGYPVDTFSAATLTEALEGLLANAVLDTPPFTISADFTSTASFEVTEPSPIRSWFGGREGSFIDIYGGEWLYDNFSCILKSRRGEDRGARAQYSKNISNYIKDLKSDSQYTHVCAVWTDTQTETSIRGSFISTGAEGITKVKFLDASTDFEDQPTTAQLDTYAEARASAYATLALNIAVEVVPLDDIQDIIELGDTVHVYYMNDFYNSRCVSVAWNVIKDKYDRITVGELRTSLAQSINDQTAQSGYTTRKDVASMIQKASPVRVIESGTNNGWQYKKFSDGTYEAFKRIELEGVACSTAWGSLYISPAQNFGVRPSFDNLGMQIDVSYVGLSDNSRGWAANWGRIAGSTYPTGTWVVVCPVSQASITGHLQATLHGYFSS